MVEAWSPFYHQHHHLELECLLKEHDAILDAGVVGIPDITKGEICHAYIRLKEGISFNDTLKDELCRFIAREYTQECIPQEFFAIDQIPKTRSGKISRQQLKVKALENIR